MLESILKIILLLIVLIAVICYWLIPRSKLAKKVKMTVGLFIVTNIIGILSGISGVAGIFIWKTYLIEVHLWELIVMPYALVMVYWLIIIKMKKSTEIVDEKQEWDMSQAAGITIGGTIVILSVMFQLSTHNLVDLNNGLWFPFYIFITILIFSLSTLLFLDFCKIACYKKIVNKCTVCYCKI